MAKATKPKSYTSQAAFAGALKVNPSTLLRWLRRNDWPSHISRRGPWGVDDVAILLAWRRDVVQNLDADDDDDDDAELLAQLHKTEVAKLRAMARASELENWADNAEAVILDLPAIAADLAGLAVDVVAERLDAWAAKTACILRGEPPAE